MARLTRYFAQGEVQHVLQRGNNRGAIFFAEEDYARYREILGAMAAREGCAIHAYVLMPNHVHLLVTPQNPASIPRTMQSLGRRYVRYINGTHGRTGTLWEGRYRATIIEAHAWLLPVTRYIETNPARAGLCRRAADYQWSSHRGHAGLAVDPLIQKHTYFMALGFNTKLRSKAWKTYCAEHSPEGELDAIRKAVNGGWVLGDGAFQARVQAETGRRAAPLPRGRPRKQAAANINSESVEGLSPKA